MKQCLSLGLAVLLSLALAGCSGGGEPAENELDNPEQSVFDPMTETMDRARGLEQDVGQRIDDLNKRIEEGEGR